MTSFVHPEILVFAESIISDEAKPNVTPIIPYPIAAQQKNPYLVSQLDKTKILTPQKMTT